MVELADSIGVGKTTSSLSQVKQAICKNLQKRIRETTSYEKVPFLKRYNIFITQFKVQRWKISFFSKLESLGLRNNSKDHGLLIYNRVPKTASSTMVEIINGLSSRNNFTFWHIPIRHYYNTTLKAEQSFLWHHYYKDPWPLLTDQHIMFVDAVEHHNIQGASKVIFQIEIKSNRYLIDSRIKLLK